MKRGVSLFIIVLAVVLFGISLTSATGAPTALHFEGNATNASLYDEGSFFVNWTSGGGGTAKNYSIYVFANNTFFVRANNNSASGYTFSNTTQSNYTFIVEARNVTDAGFPTNSSGNITIFVDSAGPVLTFNSYTNATQKTNLNNLTLNLSVTDGRSGLTSSKCLIDVNGTNQTVAVSSGWCNTTTLSLAGLADGNQTIKVYANDTVNNIGSNESFFVVWIDSSAPTATAACSNVNEGEAIGCTCTGTDSASTISSATGSSNSPDGIGVQQTVGVYTYTCIVTDAAGNGAVSTKTYAVNNIGGSGGSTTTTPGSKTTTFSQVTPGSASIVKYTDATLGVKEIQINVSNPAQNVQITVTKYDGKPAAVTVSKDRTIKYVQINVNNVAGKLSNAVVKFQVEKSRVSNKNNIVVSKFDATDEKWNDLPTVFASEDSNYYYYDVQLNSFSYFAISEQVTTGETPAGEQPSTETPEPTTEGNGPGWFFWVLVIVVVGIIAWWFVGNRKHRY